MAATAAPEPRPFGVPSSERELIDELDAADGKRKRKLPRGTEELNDFTTMILEHLGTSGVQQAKKEDRITFTSITGWPGTWIAADGRFMEGEVEKRAAIFIGPEFGTVSRADLTAAAREALDARFDALIACGFNFEAHTSELNKLGLAPFTPHDLRRTAATMCGELGLSEAAISLCLDHQANKDDDGKPLPAITRKVYNRATRIQVAKKRGVLNAWAVELRRIVDKPVEIARIAA